MMLFFHVKVLCNKGVFLYRFSRKRLIFLDGDDAMSHSVFYQKVPYKLSKRGFNGIIFNLSFITLIF